MKLDRTLHQYKIELSISFLIIGIGIIILTGGGALSDEASASLFLSIKESLGNWIYWLLVLGTVMALLGVFYLSDYVSKRRQFYKLFNEKSKSKFIRNQDRIEELAWRLHPKYEEMVIDRKKELRIK